MANSSSSPGFHVSGNRPPRGGRHLPWYIPAIFAGAMGTALLSTCEKEAPPPPAPEVLHTRFDAAVAADGKLYMRAHGSVRADHANLALRECIAEKSEADCMALTQTQRQFVGAAEIDKKVRSCSSVSAHGKWPDQTGALFAAGATAQEAIANMGAACTRNGHCTTTTAIAACNYNNDRLTGPFTYTHP